MASISANSRSNIGNGNQDATKSATTNCAQKARRASLQVSQVKLKDLGIASSKGADTQESGVIISHLQVLGLKVTGVDMANILPHSVGLTLDVEAEDGIEIVPNLQVKIALIDLAQAVVKCLGLGVSFASIKCFIHINGFGVASIEVSPFEVRTTGSRGGRGEKQSGNSSCREGMHGETR
jgi:hypothetical protein